MNPVTNQHWTSLDEVKQCAYRLNYHNNQAKTTSSLAVIQAPPPPSNRCRGRSLQQGGSSGGRGHSRGAYGRGYDRNSDGYNRGGRHGDNHGRGYGSGRGRGSPHYTSYPSRINKSVWSHQEHFLTNAFVCLYCFEDVRSCGGESNSCPSRTNPKNIWDVPVRKLQGCDIKPHQLQQIFPANAT